MPTDWPGPQARSGELTTRPCWRFADAALGSDAGALAAARTAVVQVVGTDGTTDAAAVIGGFDGITRIAGATGMPPDSVKEEASADCIAALVPCFQWLAGPIGSPQAAPNEWGRTLGIDRFRAAQV
jgi:hypothetical protein